MSARTNHCVISAIIERTNAGTTEVLVQTRWKLEKDPVYSGTIEIPAGAIEAYEDVIDALKREVYEETGLAVTRIRCGHSIKGVLAER